MHAIGYLGLTQRMLFNLELPSSPPEKDGLGEMPMELKLRICLDLDLLDIVHLRTVSRCFKQAVDQQITTFAKDYEEDFKGWTLQKNPMHPCTFYTLLKKVQCHTALYHQKPELISLIGSLSKLLTLPVHVPEQEAYKTLREWINAQTLEDWKEKPNVSRVQGQHFEDDYKTGSLILKYSLFLPKEVQRGPLAVDQIWKGYLYTESNALSTGTYLISDLTHRVDQLFNENYKSWDFISYLFCGTIPKDLSTNKYTFIHWVFSKFFISASNRIATGYFTKIQGHPELNVRFQAFMNGQPLSFFNRLPESFKKSHSYLEKMKIVLGWDTQE